MGGTSPRDHFPDVATLNPQRTGHRARPGSTLAHSNPVRAPQPRAGEKNSGRSRKVKVFWRKTSTSCIVIYPMYQQQCDFESNINIYIRMMLRSLSNSNVAAARCCVRWTHLLCCMLVLVLVLVLYDQLCVHIYSDGPLVNTMTSGCT